MVKNLRFKVEPDCWVIKQYFFNSECWGLTRCQVPIDLFSTTWCLLRIKLM